MKRFISFVLALIILTGVCAVRSDALNTYNDRAVAMVNYFKDNDIAGMDSITDEEFRLFAVYISNFYTPFLTNESNLSSVVEQAVAFIRGYSDTSSMSENDKELTKSMATAIIANIQKNSVDLTVNDGEGSLKSLFGMEESTEEVKRVIKRSDNGETVMKLTLSSDGWGSGTDYSSIDNFIMSLCIDKAARNGINNNEANSTEWWDIFKEYYKEGSVLKMTPFGDIIICNSGMDADIKFTVLVPACLNRTVYSTGEDSVCKIPLLNSFMFGRLNTGKGVREGNSTTFPGITSTDKNISFDETFDDYYNHHGTVRSDKLCCDDNYIVLTGLRGLEIVFDKDLYDEYTNINNSSDHKQPLLDATKSVGGVTKDFYTYTYGEKVFSYLSDLYDKTEKDVIDAKSVRGVISLFNAGILDASCFDTDMVFFSSEQQPVHVELYSNDKYGGMVHIGNSTIKNGVYLEYTGVTLKGMAKNKHICTYYIDNPFEAYTAYSPEGSNEETGHIILAKTYAANNMSDMISMVRLSNASGNNVMPWAEMFYNYMLKVDVTGENLPSCNKDAMSSIGNYLSESGMENGADPDKALKDKANTLMNRMLAFTNDNMNGAKGNLITNTINSWILTQHRKMLGLTEDRNNTAVSNDALAYSGFTGHVTTPRLRDVEFTANIIDNYRSIYFTLLAILLLFSIMMIMIHMRSPLQAVATFLVMAIVLVLPQSAIDLSIQLSNTLNEQLYNNRFNYWAILQHQQALSITNSADDGDDEVASAEEAIANSMVNMKSYWDDTGVRLKWMSPKKHDDAADLLENGEKAGDNLTVGKSTFKWLFGNYLSGESYADDSLATYCYRTYTSLAKEAQYMWENKIKGNSISAYNNELLGYAKDYDYLYNLSGNLSETADINGTYQQPWKTKFIDTARTRCLYENTGSLFTSSVSSVLSDPEKYTIPFSSGVTDVFGRDDELYCYGLYSESPFYYFYNTFMSMQVSDNERGIGTNNGTTTFLTSLLAESPYKVTEGELVGYYKDFLDIEGLFTYVVPYLQAANEYVIRWTDLYGLDGGVIGNSEEQRREYLQQVWNCYSPWVDALYSTDIYAGKIKTGGKTVGIVNAFSPYAYEGDGNRPMVFGEADMYAQGVSPNDLSEVERKIQEVLEKTYEDIRYLANYSNFSDEALCTAAAMIATFNFNEVFSQNKLIGEDIIMYPQGYEMKNFSYDAFLRLILLNSTGQSPTSEVDIYTSILKNTGFWTGVFLLITDLLAIYVLPLFKFIFVIGVFLLSIVMCIGIYLQKLDQVPKVILNAILIPMFSFVGISFGHALATALLMGEGLTDYVGAQTGAFVTNDPTITLITLTVINATACVLLFILLKKLIITLIDWVKDTVGAMTGVLTALGGALTAKVSEFAATGKISLGGAKVENSGSTGEKGNVSSGVGYRTSSSSSRPLAARQQGAMPAGLSRKLNSVKHTVSNNIAKAGANVGKTAKHVAAGAALGTAGVAVGVAGGLAKTVSSKTGLTDKVSDKLAEGQIKKTVKKQNEQMKKLIKANDKYADKANKEINDKYNDWSKNYGSEVSSSVKSGIEDYEKSRTEYDSANDTLNKMLAASDKYTADDIAKQRRVCESMLDACKSKRSKLEEMAYSKARSGVDGDKKDSDAIKRYIANDKAADEKRVRMAQNKYNVEKLANDNVRQINDMRDEHIQRSMDRDVELGRYDNFFKAATRNVSKSALKGFKMGYGIGSGKTMRNRQTNRQ